MQMTYDPKQLVFALLALTLPFQVYGQGPMIAARVDGTEIPSSKVTIPMKNLVALFKKHLGRNPNQTELAELEEFRLECQHWMLCAKIRETVAKKIRETVKTRGSVDPQKTKALERSILEQAALEDPEVTSYLKVRKEKRDPTLERHVFQNWEKRQLQNANIEILEESYKPCLRLFENSVVAPPLAKVIQDFFEAKKQSEASIPE